MAQNTDITGCIQKALRTTLEEVSVILDLLTSKETGDALSSAVNFSEQYFCCQRVNLKETPLDQFSDLKTRLSYKILQHIEEKLRTVQSALVSLENCQQKISAQREDVMATYRRVSSEESLQRVIRGEPLRPSLAAMMEWLEDIDRDVFYLLCEKRFLLEQLDLQSEETFLCLQSGWLHDQDLGHKISDIKAHLHFFLQEKI